MYSLFKEGDLKDINRLKTGYFKAEHSLFESLLFLPPMQSEEFIAKNSFQRRPLLWVGYKPYKSHRCWHEASDGLSWVHWCPCSLIWAQSELLLGWASSLSFWLQMITAARAARATVASSNWFRVNVPCLRDLIMVRVGPSSFDLLSRMTYKNLDS